MCEEPPVFGVHLLYPSQDTRPFASISISRHLKPLPWMMVASSSVFLVIVATMLDFMFQVRFCWLSIYNDKVWLLYWASIATWMMVAGSSVFLVITTAMLANMFQGTVSLTSPTFLDFLFTIEPSLLHTSDVVEPVTVEVSKDFQSFQPLGGEAWRI